MPKQEFEKVHQDMLNSQKAALLLIALGKRWVLEILPFLTNEEVRKISYWVDAIDCVPEEQVKRAVGEFYDKLYHKSRQLSGIYAGKQQQHMLEREPNKLVLEILETEDSKRLANYLEGEEGKTIVWMIYCLDSDRAASIFSELSLKKQFEVLKVLSGIEKGDSSIQEVAEKIMAESKRSFSQERIRKKGIELAAEILRCLEQKQQESIFQEVAKKDFDLAERLKKEP